MRPRPIALASHHPCRNGQVLHQPLLDCRAEYLTPAQQVALIDKNQTEFDTCFHAIEVKYDLRKSKQ
jgi:hypothetical protein